MRGRIQASESTAGLLIECGKEHWVSQREDSVEAKGKGVVQTYWVHPRVDSQHPKSELNPVRDKTSLRSARSTQWVTRLLLDYAKKIRGAADKQTNSDLMISGLKTGKTPMEEVVEVITLKQFDEHYVHKSSEAKKVVVSSEIESSLAELVTCIAQTYHDNPFHNFNHGMCFLCATSILTYNISRSLLGSSEC